MKFMSRLMAITALAVLPAGAAVGQVIYGICSHMGQNRTSQSLLSDWLKQTGFTSFRDEIYWGDIERVAGVFEPNARAKHTLSFINRSTSDGMHPLVVLDYGNQFYDGGDQPYSDQGRAGFAKYSQYIAKTTNPDVNLFEIWNEWNIGAGTRPSRRPGDPGDYAKLVAATAQAVHSVKPTAKIIAGALADDLGDWPWLRQSISKGLLNYADGISIHFYNYLNPISNTGEVEFMNRLKQLESIIKQAKPKNTPKIYITEMGWPNHEGRGAVSQDVAAATAIRFILTAKESDSIAGIWFYELQDGGVDPHEKEHHFGFLNKDGSEKPINCATEKLIPIIGDYALQSSTIENGIKHQIYVNSKDSTFLTAVWKLDWSDNRPSALAIKSKSEYQTIDLSCKKNSPSIQKGDFKADLTTSPLLILHRGELSVKQ